MRQLIAALVLTFTAASAVAVVGPRRKCDLVPILLDNNDMSTARTFSVTRLDGYTALKFDVQFTHAANGTITFTCTHKSAFPADIPAGLVVQADITPTTCTTSGGTCTLNFAGVWVTPTLTADKDFAVDAGIINIDQLDCSVVHSAGTSSDFITVTGKKCVR